MPGSLLAWMQKIDSPTFYTWGFKSIDLSYNIHICFMIIASNAEAIKAFKVSNW